jgi:hypothetical protein
MKLFALVTAILLAACASNPGAARTTIARSCPWILTPLGDSAQADNQVMRACSCAARAVEAEWPADRLQRFDAALAEFASRMRQWAQRTDVGDILTGGSEPPPEFATEARPDLQAFGLHVRQCGRGALEFENCCATVSEGRRV